MGLAKQLAGRNLKARPGRTLLAILGIAMGIAIATGVLVLDHNTVAGMQRASINETLPDLMLRAPEGSTSIERLRETEGISLAVEGFQESALVGVGEGNSRERGTGIRLLAFEKERLDDFGLVVLESGRSLRGGAPFEVLLGAPLAEALGVSTGSTVWLSRPPRLGRRVCEDGKLVALAQPVLDQPTRQAFTVVGILARNAVGRTAGGSVAVVDFPEGRGLFEGKPVRSTFWAKRAEGSDAAALEASLSQVYSLEINHGTVIGQAADERAFRTGVRIAGLFALVLGLFVIFHTLSISLTERVVEVGTLHALGASRGQIARVFFTEAFAQAVFGGLLGVALGLVMARSLLAAGLTTLGSGKHIEIFEIPWPVVSGLAGAGVLVALCGSVYPLMLLGGADPGAALRGDREISANRRHRGFALFYGALIAVLLPGLYFALVPAVEGGGGQMTRVILGAVGVLVGVVALALVAPRVIAVWAAGMLRPWVGRFPFSARLARSGMLRSPGRIGASASAIALVAAGFVGLRGLTDSLRGEIDTWAQQAVHGKVWIKDMPTVDFAALAKHVRQDPQVLGIEMGQSQVNLPFLILGNDIDGIKDYGPLQEDPQLVTKMRSGHGMIISRRLAQDAGYAVGEAIYLEKANREIQPFTIVAISDAYGHWSNPDERMYGVVDAAYLERYFCVDPQAVNRVALRFANDSGDPQVAQENAAAAVALVQDFLATQTDHDPSRLAVETGADLHAFHRSDLDRDFRLFDILILLSAGLAGLGVLNGQLLATLERAKEFGITQAMGASRRQVAALIGLEALALSVVGGLLGVLIGAAIVPPVVSAVQSLSSLELPQVIRLSVLLTGLAGAVLVGLLACLYPIYRLGRMDTLRAVRTG